MRYWIKKITEEDFKLKPNLEFGIDYYMLFLRLIQLLLIMIILIPFIAVIIVFINL